MQSFFSCFACGDNSSGSVVTPQKQITPSKLIQTSEIQVKSKQNDDDKSRVSMTTVTYLTSETAPTKDEDVDTDIRRRLQVLKSKALPQRKAMESQFIRHNSAKGKVIYLVDKKWSEDYTNFLRDHRIHEMPPINNQRLLNSHNELREDAKQRYDYFIVTEKTWKFVQALYGGGPTIIKDITFPVCPLNFKKLTLPIFGLENPEYLCYMNSVLQCLFSIEQFNSYIFKKQISGYRRNFLESSNTSEIKKKPLHMNLYKAIKTAVQVKESTPENAEVLNFKQLLMIFEDKFKTSVQHDAQEFMLYFFQLMQEQMRVEAFKPPFKGSDPDSVYALYFREYRSIIDKAFAGLQQTIVTCAKCDHRSITFTPFLDLILNLTGNTLEKCIKDYFQPEKLEDNYKCEQCKKQGKATKQVSISKSPHFLVIVLKKFSSVTLNKIGQRIAYPFDISLNKYCKGHCGDPIYSLQSLIIHKGSKSNKGHYYCFTKRNKSQWYWFDDNAVRRLQTKYVSGRDPYILIYERIK